MSNSDTSREILVNVKHTWQICIKCNVLIFWDYKTFVYLLTCIQSVLQLLPKYVLLPIYLTPSSLNDSGHLKKLLDKQLSKIHMAYRHRWQQSRYSQLGNSHCTSTALSTQHSGAWRGLQHQRTHNKSCFLFVISVLTPWPFDTVKSIYFISCHFIFINSFNSMQKE
jgi:hypothetical protein